MQMPFAVTAALVGLAAAAIAHPNHEHKVMGEVVAISETAIEVRSTDGKKVTGALSAETKYLRGETPVNRDDVEAGQRVVIVVVEDEEKVQMVKQVLLGTARAAEQED